MAQVDIYTRMFCGYCSAAKDLLARKGAEVTEFDATLDPGLREEMIRRSNGGRTFPQIFVNGTHVGGCTELIQLDREGRLDAMLAEETA